MGITIERQAPERGQRAMAAAPAGQCCCCCCCCLHSLGGAIGALTARPTVPAAPPSELAAAVIADAGPTREPRYSATGLYWALVAIVAGVLGAYFLVLEGQAVETAKVALVVAIFLPAIQLAASIVGALVIAVSKRPGKDARMRHLGKISLRAFLGAVIGGLLMLPLLQGC